MTTSFVIDPKLRIGITTLNVRDLVAMTNYYQDVIGLSVLDSDVDNTTLGIAVSNMPLLRLVSSPNGRAEPNATGLFHIAFVLPTRADLGNWVKHYLKSHKLNGAGDHLVSEAFYLDDPEGNGIEIYCDRPREAWQRKPDGGIRMDTLAVDIRSLLADAEDTEKQVLPVGTETGHIHLQVDDTARSRAFYHDVLGLDLVTDAGHMAFFSAGGYHHHIGANIWNSRGAPARSADALGLVSYELAFSTARARNAVVSRLDDAGVDYDKVGDSIAVTDPAGLGVHLTVSAAA